MRWLVRGDWDGFFGLALDNLVQLLLIVSLCQFVLGFSPELIYGRILPGAAISLIVGNFFYGWQARRLAQQTGRTDVCALPYGINTVSLLAHVFLVMLPAKSVAQNLGMDPAQQATFAWQMGLVATFGCGFVELIGVLFADAIRRATPRAALLSTLAGIAVGFIAMTFFFRSFARPIVGIPTLGIILLTYLGGRRFKFGLPGGLVAITVGTALAWITGLATTDQFPQTLPTLVLPSFAGAEFWSALQSEHWSMFLSVILPMGLFNLVGSLQNIESAEAAGDRYPTRPSLAVNGIGSIAACLFGSTFPTTIYIGHPAWKAMGARAGYSILNGVFCTIVCLTGVIAHIAAIIPIDAGMAIIVYIGVIITTQAFQATPIRHAPAVVLGLLPGIAAWGTLMIKNGLRAAGIGTPERPFQQVESLLPTFQGQFDLYVDGAFALNEGFIFTSMIWAALTVALIERQFRIAAIWCLIAAALSAIGFIHSYTYTPGDTAMALFAPASPWALAYAVTAALLFATPYLTQPNPPQPPKDES
ncbi:SulP family inorganic anion transporter [Tuwongella immobilis]|uniref:Permease n=1 Tax=Tuwongella immobilis TaxID=692036 RepID=A0A6C2YKD3_9BACT|nr:NCS2 family permease [Tuwongella immobilis]VIP02040.1 Uncharacterized protein OS=Sandaracinus amylolyticus GN=DB32_6291 PE=4 SV=1 [Tuwongella immobilis]VTS00207.1 Uncharacterized protein OS=Sandaracinus amylolyticus GN=DB32_6291 PE=4 SV=1 [Tuwongella immobilis]